MMDRMNTPVTFISPTFSAEKLEDPSYEDLVDVFEDQILGWYLDPVGILLAKNGGDFAACALMMSYFEGIEECFRGRSSKGRSREFFAAGFLRLFPLNQSHADFAEKVINSIYDQLRCGFAHEGMLRNRVYVSRVYNEPMVISIPQVDGMLDPCGPVESILINPERLYVSIKTHFEGYIRMLRAYSNIELKEAFERAVRARWALEEPARVIALSPEELHGP